jgi:indolepyruvate ferredoxin oxidoreductase beta subunit
VKQRIIISGRGGQGVLTLTRVMAEAAAAAGHEVITTETHGMAQRGGAVLSTIKVGSFHGPLVASGEAEVGLFLHADNLAVHSHFLRPGAPAVINADDPADHHTVHADRLASLAGQPRAANLALLGYAAGKGVLFADVDVFAATIQRITPARHLDQNLAAFRAGVDASR